MEIIKPEVQTAQTSPQESELVLKEGEKISVNFIRRLESGMILLNIKGKNVSAEADFTPTLKSFTAVPVRTQSGGVQLKFFPPLIEFAETTQTKTASDAQVQRPQIQGDTAKSMPQTIQQNNAQTTQQAAARTVLHDVQKQEMPLGTATLKSDPKIILKSPEQTASQTAQNTAQGQDVRRMQTHSSLQNTQYTQTAGIKQAETVTSDGKTLMIKLPSGSLPVTEGETVKINILKMNENGKMLISVKDSVFEVKLSPQVFKTLFAEVQTSDDSINLSLLRLPVENLDQSYVKQQVSGLDIETLLKAFGKFKQVDMENLNGEKLKTALKDSGLTFENKLLNGDNVSTDEKFNALLNSDTSAKDGITKMQVANMMLAGGIFAFLKTQDENVSDTLLRYKKNQNGSDTVYVSTTFSELGDTLIVIRPAAGSVSVTVKTEKDISDLISSIPLENASIHWYKFNRQDLELLDPKKDISADIGAFEVII